MTVRRAHRYPTLGGALLDRSHSGIEFLPAWLQPRWLLSLRSVIDQALRTPFNRTVDPHVDLTRRSAIIDAPSFSNLPAIDSSVCNAHKRNFSMWHAAWKRLLFRVTSFAKRTMRLMSQRL